MTTSKRLWIVPFRMTLHGTIHIHAESARDAEKLADKRLNVEHISLVHTFRLGSFQDFQLSTKFEREQEIKEARLQQPEQRSIQGRREKRKLAKVKEQEHP